MDGAEGVAAGFVARDEKRDRDRAFGPAPENLLEDRRVLQAVGADGVVHV